MKFAGILFFLLTGCLIRVRGQETERFHADPDLFMQEARDYFGSYHPEESRAILSDFDKAGKEGLLEENEWIDLAGKCNRLDQTGGKPYPEFYTLLQVFLKVVTRDDGLADYRVWSEATDSLMTGNRRNLNRLMDFLNFTNTFIDSGVLSKSGAFLWKATGGSWHFGMDSLFHVSLRSFNLVSTGSGDSTVILATGGRYYPSNGWFAGEGGQVTWEKLGLKPGQVQVRLNHYRLDLSRSSYRIDSVNLIDHRYFTQPLTGELENKMQPGIGPAAAGYPRFTSYELRNQVKNLYPGMDYEGGFSLQGLKVLGTGNATSKGVLTIYYHDHPLMRLASTYFSFQEDRARGINTEASIYLGTDSIYHPGLLFQYTVAKKEISLIRDGQGLSPSRFFNTYHLYDLNVDWIRWDMGDDFMTMSGLPGSIKNEAWFESADFFNIDRYNEIMMNDKQQPVAVVKQCADYYHSRQYTLEDLSKFMKKPQHLVEEMLLRLSFLGFVRYSTETQLVEVQERSFDFLKKNAGLQDYDVIRFESVENPPQGNAELSLKDFRLKVDGVRSIEISQARQVVIFPKDQHIEILKGRDILFDGEIQGGLAHFDGKGFRFRYDDFAIRLGNVSRINFKVYEKELSKKGIPLTADVTSIIEDTRGTLRLDKPTDKSGVRARDLPGYPILETDTNAFVYYDQQEILNGVYPRKTFNFNIEPFRLKGLTLLSFADSLVFPGRFVTAGIFPTLNLSLRHQKDHSLGFATLKTPSDGYPVYGGKGRFYNTIAMSKSGLRGSGRLEYLNSLLVSDDFLFLPDRVTTVASMFAINRDTTGSGNPETRGEQMAITWFPESNRLIAKGTKGPVNLYGNGSFDGILSLQPGSLTGQGTLTFDGYSVTSDSLRFNETTYDVVDGIVRIFRNPPPEKADTSLASDYGSIMVAYGYDGTVDVSRQKASFAPSGISSRLAFSKNSFEGKPTEVLWDMNKGVVSLDDIALKRAVKPSDTLNFRSSQTDFVLSEPAVYAHGVNFIDVADVRIYPSDKNVTIRRNAVIDSLTATSIVSRDTSLVHRITNATVSIKDQRDYLARGYYQYHDITGRDFPVYFSEIRPSKEGISTGSGEIAADAGFTLSPAFRYYGPVEWNNNERFLKFSGQTQLTYTCTDNTPQWIRFDSRINPDSVAIPVDSVTKNDQGDRLFKGFFLSNQPVELYSTFIGPHLRYSDTPLISANGWLWFDEAQSRYILASGAKRADPDADGPIIGLDVKKCLTEATGPLTLGVDLGQVRLNGAGTLVDDLKQDSIKGSVMLVTDFFLDDKLLDFMAGAINDATGLEPVNYSSPSFRSAFVNLLGHATGQELLRQISLTGKWKKIPEELLHTIVFTDINLKWNPETGSYQSTGKIGIANIGETSVNKKIPGYLEILHRRGGDAMTLYLELDRQNYFFLTYSRGVMQCVAGPGQEKFNSILKKTKEKKRRLKTEPGEPEYQYYIGTYGQVSAFLRKFNVSR